MGPDLEPHGEEGKPTRARGQALGEAAAWRRRYDRGKDEDGADPRAAAGARDRRAQTPRDMRAVEHSPGCYLRVRVRFSGVLWLPGPSPTPTPTIPRTCRRLSGCFQSERGPGTAARAPACLKTQLEITERRFSLEGRKFTPERRRP